MDQQQEQVEVVGLVLHRRAEAESEAVLDRPGTGGGTDRFERPRKIAALLHQVAPAQQRRGNHGLERVSAEHLAVDVARKFRGAARVLLADHQVELPADQGWDRHLGLGLDEFDAQPLMLALAVEQCGNQGAGGAAEGGHPAGACRWFLSGTQLGLGEFECGQDVSPTLGQPVARLGEPYAAANTLEQSGTGLAFEEGQLLGDARRAHVHCLGDRGDGAAVAEFDQEAQPTYVQHKSILGRYFSVAAGSAAAIGDVVTASSCLGFRSRRCAVPTTEPFLLNPRWTSGGRIEPRETKEVRRFHEGMQDYKVTPLVPLPSVATALDLGTVLVKDESLRFGLPAFKMLGASWAVHRALDAGGHDRNRLITATDGNHGRAVARMAALLDLPATIVVPNAVAQSAVALIRDEGADVRVLHVPYDEAVRQAATLAEADPDALLVQDTSWPGYEDVPRWIVDGYATLFDEAADQAADLGAGIDLVVVPAGVGSLAHAAVLFGLSRSECRIVAVEPDVAACLRASLIAGAPTTVPTGETSMAGLNCGTPSYLAWPDLARGLAGAVVVDDGAAANAIGDLAALGVDSGPCGAASLAALRILATEPARSSLGLSCDSSVLLLNTEGSDAAG